MPKIEYIADNFNAASMEKIELINEILEEYAAAGYEMTLRQAYYQMVARGYIPNNDREYKNLATLVSRGRMAGLIDWDHIIDTTRQVKSLSHWNNPAQIIRAVHSGYSLDKWQGQKYKVEVWVEKDAAVSIISGICDQLDLPYFSCRGYTGQAAMGGCAMRLLDYIQQDRQIPVILHLGDHDPSGIDMSRDIENRLRIFLDTHFEMDDDWPDWYNSIDEESGEQIWGSFIFERVALNMSQVLRYSPPPNPTKTTDRRAKGYIEQYGDESWELDALRPEVVAELIRDFAGSYTQIDKKEEVLTRELQDKELLGKLANNWFKVREMLND